MICATGRRRKTADDWKWMGDELNAIGAKTQREGFQFGYHKPVKREGNRQVSLESQVGGTLVHGSYITK